ncbi:MAG: hypothetical protein ACRD3F_14405 [Acidobacteriaceae bacterium]
MMGQSSDARGRRRYSRLFLALLGLAVLAAIAGLGWSYHLSGRLTHAEAELMQAQQQNQKLASALDETNARLKTNQSLGQSLDITQKQLQQRARSLLKRQQPGANHGQNEQQVSSASNGTPGLGPETGGDNSNAGRAPDESNANAAQLQSVTGDLGIASGPIATNQQALNVLEQKGDRRYYPFTLQKGKKQSVSTVSLELKKADVKHSRYTIIVYTNNVKIQKKNKGLNEPLQFYTGKENFLFELVVNSIEKNEVKGYLVAPLNAPVPSSTSGS